MKNVLLSSLILVAILASPTMAGRKFDMVIEPNLTFGHGYSKYVLDETGYLDSLGSVGHVKSELIFPLDGPDLGLTLGVKSKPSSKCDWSLLATFTIGADDPGGKMYDRDWLYWPGHFDGLFSYTASDVQQTSHSEAFEARLSLTKLRLVSFGIVGGCRFQKFSQDIISLDGWQTDPFSGSDSVYTYSITGVVGYYSVTWKSMYGGFYYEIRPVQALHVNVMAAYAPTWFTDRDTHSLRNRAAAASGNGRGFVGRLQTSLDMGNARQRLRPTIGLNADWYSFSVQSSQTIYWYGDDPASPGFDDTGTIMTGIPHHVTSRQFNLMVHAGFRF